MCPVTGDRSINSDSNRERAVLALVPLLILHLMLLSVQIEDSSGTMLIKTWVLRMQSPLLTAGEAVSGGFGYIWSEYIWLVGARQENRELQEQVNHLSLLNQANEQMRQENDRLRQLLAMSETKGLRMIGARITARMPEFLSNVIYVNRGSQDGVYLNAPAFSDAGIVGRVVLVTDHHAQIQLLTNPAASIGVMLEQSRTPGVLVGSGEQILSLHYISNTQSVDVGEVVVSSGLDGIFPKGIVIGKVVASDKGNDVFREIKVQPVMDMIHLEEVAILLDVPGPLEQVEKKSPR